MGFILAEEWWLRDTLGKLNKPGNKVVGARTNRESFGL